MQSHTAAQAAFACKKIQENDPLAWAKRAEDKAFFQGYLVQTLLGKMYI